MKGKKFPGPPALPAEEAAEALGVELETYTRVRNKLQAILQAELDAYWTILCGTYRIAVYLERRKT